jgi:hypothetical protein
MISLSDSFLIKLNGGVHLHECLSYEGPRPDGVDEIIPVCYYGRSGTTFFMSLLEDHPEIISLGASEFREYFKRFDFMVGRGTVETQLSNVLRHYARNLEYAGKNENNFVEINGRSIHVPATLSFTVEKPENGNLCYAEPEENDCNGHQGPYIGFFISIFLRMVETFYSDVRNASLSAKDFFVCFSLAYNWAIGRKYSISARKIAWNMHIPDPVLAKDVQDAFPNVTVVHMIRRPLQTIGSHLKCYIYPAEGMVTNIPIYNCVNRLFVSLLSGDKPLIKCRAGDDEFAIRLEDVHSSPREMLGKVAHRLGVSWSDTLMESTFFGKVFEWGSSSRRKPIIGFTTSHLHDDHLDIFSNEDVRFIEGILYDNYKQWGYEVTNDDASREEMRSFVAKRIPVPLRVEVICWERACQEGAGRTEIIGSYDSLRDILKERLAAEPALLKVL